MVLSVIAFNQQLERTRSSVFIGQVRCERCIFYQVLSMKCDCLPRASKVEATRSELNKTVELFSIPTFDGSYRHIETAIREENTRVVSVFTNISYI